MKDWRTIKEKTVKVEDSIMRIHDPRLCAKAPRPYSPRSSSSSLSLHTRRDTARTTFWSVSRPSETDYPVSENVGSDRINDSACIMIFPNRVAPEDDVGESAFDDEQMLQQVENSIDYY